MKIELTCPLGSECETARDGTLYRCRWYRAVRGEHPQTGAETDEWDCSIPWTLIGVLESARTNRGQTAALESFRNEVVQGNNSLVSAIAMSDRKMIEPG